MEHSKKFRFWIRERYSEIIHRLFHETVSTSCRKFFRERIPISSFQISEFKLAFFKILVGNFRIRNKRVSDCSKMALQDWHWRKFSLSYLPTYNIIHTHRHKTKIMLQGLFFTKNIGLEHIYFRVRSWLETFQVKQGILEHRIMPQWELQVLGSR